MTAMTGEISIHGYVKPVGGIFPKVKAAKQAGAKKVIVPLENMQAILREMKEIEIIPVRRLDEVFAIVFGKNFIQHDSVIPAATDCSKTKSI